MIMSKSKAKLEAQKNALSYMIAIMVDWCSYHNIDFVEVLKEMVEAIDCGCLHMEESE